MQETKKASGRCLTHKRQKKQKERDAIQLEEARGIYLQNKKSHWSKSNVVPNKLVEARGNLCQTKGEKCIIK